MKKRLLSAPNIVIGLLCIMYFLTYVDRVNLSNAMPTIGKEFGLNDTQKGFLLSVFGYPYALLQIPGGLLGDRLGARKTLFLCGGLWAIATVVTGLAIGLVSLALFRIALGFGEGATFPTATKAMQSWVPTSQRSWAQGLTHAFSRLGNAVTPLFMAGLMSLWGWRYAFVALGLVSMIWVIGWWLYYRDDPKDHAGIHADDLARLPPHRPKMTTLPGGRLILRILPVTLTYFCYGWTLWLMLTWLPSFFQESLKLNIKGSAIYLFIIYISGFFGDAVGGVASDYLLHKTGRVVFSRLVVVIVGMLGAAGLLIPVLYSRDLVTLTACLAGAFFCLELCIGPMWAVPMDIAPQHSGTASGIMNTGSAIAAIVSPQAFGIILDLSHKDYHLPFYGSVGLLIIGAALSFTMHPDRKFVDEPALAPAIARETTP